MHIKSLEIKNYRGLDIKIDNVEKIAMLIGKNDSGKTNICHAILKVLDFKSRRVPFSISDSTNSNKGDIYISIVLSMDSLDDEQKGIIGKYVSECDSERVLHVTLNSTYNNETEEYEDTLIYGDLNGDSFEQRNGIQTDLDKILSVVYIGPLYSIEDSENNYFSFVEKNNKKSDLKFGPDISDKIESLNKAIECDPITKQIESDINDNGNFSQLFEDYLFKIVPKVKNENLYKTLDVIPSKNETSIEHIGDAKNKMLSTVLKSKIYETGKQKIFLIEEPENHLYVLLQKMYIKALLNLKPEQIIFTTHSPFTIDFEKVNQIIKIVEGKEVYTFNNLNSFDFKKYGYLITVQIAEMLYYDEVLLVEGSSEKYFYSYLMSIDEFAKKINERKLGICSIDGIAFKITKELLERLGIKVFIKTDNDVFHTQDYKNKKYAGILRCLSYVSSDDANNLFNKTKLNKNDLIFDSALELNQVVEDKMNEICEFFKQKGILLSKHKLGFEKDLTEFLQLCGNTIEEDKIVKYLKQAKLKNLHEFINEEDYKIVINEESKKSILINFIYE